MRPGRVFVARLLNFLKGMPGEGKVDIDPDIHKDLEWWARFLPRFNGVSMIPVADWSAPDQVLATDACLVGCGGLAEGEYFHAPFPSFIQGQALHINALELLTIMVALRLWSHRFASRRILIFCDNMSSVLTLNAGATKDAFCQACLREIAFMAASHEFELKAVHLPGIENRIPDLLSRWDLHPRCEAEFSKLARGDWEECVVDDQLFRFLNFW